MASGNRIVDFSTNSFLSPNIFYPQTINYSLLFGFLGNESQLNFYGYETDLFGNDSYYLIKSEFGSETYSAEPLPNDHQGGSLVQVGNRTWIVGGQNVTGKIVVSLDLSEKNIKMLKFGLFILLKSNIVMSKVGGDDVIPLY